MLKLNVIKDAISKPLTNLINASFTTGIHPDNLKMSKTIPVFKKGSRLTVSNYRPISLLSNINKIFEKLIFNRVYSFLEKQRSVSCNLLQSFILWMSNLGPK